MTTYQIQYKLSDEDLSKISQGVGEAPWGAWKVIAETHSLKSALNSSKALVKKYGYERIQICRSTKMNIKVELES